MAKTIIMDHPLIQHKIGIIRREDTSSKEFREMIGEVAMLMCYEAARELPDHRQEVGRQENGGSAYSARRPGNG